MRNCCRYFGLTSFYLLVSLLVHPQAVPVREEPLHKPVLLNQYLRLMDVWLKPGDTSLFHIHEIPSIFCYLSDGRYLAKVEGENKWNIVEAVAGQSWYRSFEEGRLVHQVANPFDSALHVTDIEILKEWKKKNIKPLPFKQIFSADKVYAYQLTKADITPTVISKRGPMVIEIVAGEVIFSVSKNNESVTLKSGEYKFIEAGTSFSLKEVDGSDLLLVLFEIR